MTKYINKENKEIVNVLGRVYDYNDKSKCYISFEASDRFQYIMLEDEFHEKFESAISTLEVLQNILNNESHSVEFHESIKDAIEIMKFENK
jgi:predicted nucleic-acid-binding protein